MPIDPSEDLSRAPDVKEPTRTLRGLLAAYGPAPSAEEIERRIEERNAARARKDFAEADRIRKALEEKGIAIEDSPSGTRWKKVH